jgi:glycosyltransferase involved in cell wall biosynthesis
MFLVNIYHNLLWSKYKGSVFTELHNISAIDSINFNFFQIAETESDRSSLTNVDLHYHVYPYDLMFNGAYEAVPRSHLIRKLFGSVWHSKADLILLPGFHRPEYWAMLLAAVLKGTKRAVFCDSTIYDQPQSFVKGLLKRLFFAFCHGFFVYGERARAYVMHYGASPKVVFYRCQAAALLPGYSSAMALQQRLVLAPSADSPHFLYVGRLSPEKSLDTLLRAFVRVRDALPAATLVLVGAGPQRQELDDLRHTLGLGNSVLFTGSMDVAALAIEYAKATCLVLPSFSEPWGLVVNEALSYGCPVVVSHRCGCVPELVENTPTGYVFEARNVGDLASKLVATPVAFADIEATARNCLDLISAYSPQASAKDIIVGCKALLAND